MYYFQYLWQHRAKFTFASKSYFKAWAKRALLVGPLVKNSLHMAALTQKGASVHPSAVIGAATINGRKSNLVVGADSVVGRATIALHATVTLGACVCINDGVLILTASHNVSDPAWGQTHAPVVICDYAWVAMNAIILPGVTIGQGAVVAAGAVVTKNVAPFTIVAGNPAKPISKNRVTNLNYSPCSFLATNLAWLKG